MEGNSRKIILVGTAHVSEKSIEDVVRVIEEEKPDAVAVELDLRRLKALKGEREEINLVEVIRKGNVSLLLFQLILSSFQKRIGKEKGIVPGKEMVSAIDKAKEIGADVLLIDRDIAITMRRLWTKLSFFEKIKLFYYTLRGFFEDEEIEVDELLKKDVLDVIIEEFRKISPKTAEILVDERDAFMAFNLLKALERYNKIVAVVGAGHKEGIEKFMKNPESIPDVKELLETKKGRISLFKVFGLVVTLAVLFLLFSILVYSGTERFISAFTFWFLANGILAALFAGIAGGHPLSILSAFFIAWLTSLSPFLAAGWFSGIVEFFVRKPTQKDVEEMLNAESFKEVYRNRAFRVLLVAAMTNIGSMIGTFYGIWYLSTHYGIDIKEAIWAGIKSILRF